jgi:hypothetical protein
MRLKRLMLTFGIIATAMATQGSGCEDTINTLDPEDLAPPLGLTSVTGDQSVTLHWQASNYGEDREGFQIFQLTGTASGTPEEIPSNFDDTPIEVDNDDEAGSFSHTVTGLTNGTTYSFLVVAFKDEGDEVSRPSNIITDTPRQGSAGTQIELRPSQNAFLDISAINPSGTANLQAGSDIQAESFDAGLGDRHGLVGVNGARIQDLGFVATWDEVDEAPLGGASYPNADFSVQALPGHVYAVFTPDNHYGKIWVRSLNSGNFGMQVSVAYQPQSGNNELDKDVPVH